jgi:thioredoxin-related protein
VKIFRLSHFVDILQIVVCFVVLGIAVGTYVSRNRILAETQAGRIAVGSKLKELPGVGYAKRPLTLVLFERSGCQFCTQSMPFYQTLARTIDRTRVQFVAASLEAKSTTEEYLHQHGVDADVIVQLDSPASHPINGTPTLVLVDNRGIVQDSWVGLLDSRGEQDVTRSLRSR